jgi:hypothetical protein
LCKWWWLLAVAVVERKKKVHHSSFLVPHCILVPIQELVRDLEKQEFCDLFLVPVNKKLVPDYYQIIKNPMDLHTIKVCGSFPFSFLFFFLSFSYFLSPLYINIAFPPGQVKLNDLKYTSSQEVLDDLALIVDNTREYNGAKAEETKKAQAMMTYATV